MSTTTHAFRFEPAPASANPAAPTLLLLHGTGGDEHDLIPLGARVASGWNLLSPRGNVLEHGQPRYFRRLREGVFDLDDMATRAADLATWLIDTLEHLGLDPDRLAALGFSNGANIAWRLMLDRPALLAGGVLLRAMDADGLPLSPPAPRASARPPAALLVSGARDPIVPHTSAAALAVRLQHAGIAVRSHTLDTGHALVQRDLLLARDFLADLARGWSAAPHAAHEK